MNWNKINSYAHIKFQSESITTFTYFVFNNNVVLQNFYFIFIMHRCSLIIYLKEKLLRHYAYIKTCAQIWKKKQSFFLERIINMLMFADIIDDIENQLIGKKYCMNLQVLIFSLKTMHLLHEWNIFFFLTQFFGPKTCLMNQHPFVSAKRNFKSDSNNHLCPVETRFFYYKCLKTS